MSTIDTNIRNLIIAIGTDMKSVQSMINGGTGNLAGLNTVQKGNIIAAINEVKAAVDAAATASSVTAQVNAAIAALVGSAPAALDTLQELAQANADVLVAIANRVRYDAAQTLTDPQKVQACANIGAVSLSDFGPVDTNYVAIYTASKA